MNPDLSQLRDIHVPDSVAWWPPAIGWWLLLGIVIVVVLLAVWWVKRVKAMRWRKVALNELARIKGLNDELLQVKEASALLRRVSLSCFPREQVAALTGDEWLAFLDRGAKTNLFQSQGELLISAPYRTDKVNAQPLLSATEQWIKTVKPVRGLQS